MGIYKIGIISHWYDTKVIGSFVVLFVYWHSLFYERQIVLQGTKIVQWISDRFLVISKHFSIKPVYPISTFWYYNGGERIMRKIIVGSAKESKLSINATNWVYCQLKALSNHMNLKWKNCQQKVMYFKMLLFKVWRAKACL